MIGILGGGLSGITLQSHLTQESEVLEKENRIGGLCRTFEKNGYKYDIGGHILFSKKKELLDFIETVLGNEGNHCKRDNKILYKGKYVKYPFENGLSSLDKEDILDCVIKFIINNNPLPTNFGEWIYHTFGSGITERYLKPYNEKIWKYPLNQMNLDWVERVPQPSVEDVIKSAIGIETDGYLHQLYFIYPKYGGIETLVKKIRKENSRVCTNYQIQKIYKQNDGWIVSNGETEKYYQRIIITFPIKEAVKCFLDVPEIVKDAASSLLNNDVRTILVGVNNQSLMNHSAIYIPQNDVAFHRICYMGYFSETTVPPGKSSVVAEVTTRNGQSYFETSDDVLVEKVVYDLDKLNIINKEEVDTVDIQNIKNGYIIYDANYKKNINIVRSYFSSIGIELLGRSAEFDYINMDEVIRRSILLADKLNGDM